MEYLNPETIIQVGGLTLLLTIVFLETGVFFGFFLPGDSLLFMAGLLSDSKYISQPVGILIAVLIIAAVSGTCFGYFFGRGASKWLEKREDSFFYKRKYLEMAHNFYSQYGMMAFVLGRFMPIVRTFVPIFAGVVKIEFSKFILFNILGAGLWVASMVLSGYWLGNLFPAIVNYIELIVIGMVVVSTLPVLMAWFKNKSRVVL